MEAYFNSLPPQVREFIQRSKAEIASPGELRLIGEHFKNSFGYTDQ
jgi:galactokinase